MCFCLVTWSFLTFLVFSVLTVGQKACTWCRSHWDWTGQTAHLVRRGRFPSFGAPSEWASALVHSLTSHCRSNLWTLLCPSAVLPRSGAILHQEVCRGLWGFAPSAGRELWSEGKRTDLQAVRRTSRREQEHGLRHWGEWVCSCSMHTWPKLKLLTSCRGLHSSVDWWRWCDVCCRVKVQHWRTCWNVACWSRIWSNTGVSN